MVRAGIRLGNVVVLLAPTAERVWALVFAGVSIWAVGESVVGVCLALAERLCAEAIEIALGSVSC